MLVKLGCGVQRTPRGTTLREEWGSEDFNMADVRLDANVARAIARALRMDEVDAPILRALHGVLADILATASDADEAPEDAQIRREIRARLDAHAGMSKALINFNVKDGKVDVRGAVTSERDRETLLAMTRAVYGVKEAHDHLVWIDRAAHTFVPSVEDSYPG